MSKICRYLVPLLVLTAALAVDPVALASKYFPSFQGTIDSVDFIKHTISVNHHTYPVSSKAIYRGAQGFGVLSSGMHIEFSVDQAGGSSQTITEITVLSR
jgi:hypothetical protein